MKCGKHARFHVPLFTDLTTNGSWTVSMGRGRFPISEGWWICIYCIQGAPHSQNGDILESSDDSSVILFMLILYDTMWSFHLAKLNVVSPSFFFYFLNHTSTFKRSSMTQTLESLNYRLLCTGALQKWSQSDPVWRKHVYYVKALVRFQASRQTYTRLPLSPNSTHTLATTLWLASLFWCLMHTSFSSPFQVEHGIRTPHREICS